MAKSAYANLSGDLRAEIFKRTDNLEMFFGILAESPALRRFSEEWLKTHDCQKGCSPQGRRECFKSALQGKLNADFDEEDPSSIFLDIVAHPELEEKGYVDYQSAPYHRFSSPLLVAGRDHEELRREYEAITGRPATLTLFHHISDERRKMRDELAERIGYPVQARYFASCLAEILLLTAIDAMRRENKSVAPINLRAQIHAMLNTDVFPRSPVCMWVVESVLGTPGYENQLARLAGVIRAFDVIYGTALARQMEEG